MENDFDNRIKDDISEKVSRQKPWSALIIWPALVITIFLFILSMVPFERDESGKINFHESITNLINIITRKKNVRIEIMTPTQRFLSIKSAIDTYLLNTGQYPTTLDDLIADPNLNGWAGPYMKPKQLNDTWGRPYIYIPYNGGKYKLISYGADGSPGGKGKNADIYND